MPPKFWKTLKDKKEGNVLFIILLCVALFALLSYAVTGTTRSTGGDTSKEQSTLTASEFAQYGTSMESAIQRMRISNGCTDTQISFENPIVAGYVNPNAPADGTCHVFKAQGGGLAYRTFKIGAQVYQPRFNGNNCVYGIGTGASTCPLTGVDLIMQIQMPPNTSSTQGFCGAINKNTGGSIPNEASMTTGDQFTGSYLIGNRIADDVPSLQGQNMGCFYEVEDNNYQAYYAIIGR